MARVSLGPPLALPEEAAAHELRKLQRDPDTAAPIAATFVVSAPVVVAIGIPMAVEIPIIGVPVEADARCGIARIGMPAIAFAIACDIGRCRN